MLKQIRTDSAKEENQNLHNKLASWPTKNAQKDSPPECVATVILRAPTYMRISHGIGMKAVGRTKPHISQLLIFRSLSGKEA
jgi:hypothetical protein